VEELMHYTQLIGGIESFWLEAYKSDAMSRGEHRDINMVMLAASLGPESFLSI
jgi:hypothetical protein